MGVLQRTVTETHRVGEHGHVQIKGVTGPMRVSGVDGDTATIRIHYRVRAADQATAERALDQAQVRIEKTSGGLLVETPERRLSTGLAWLFGGSRVTAEIEAAIPRGAEIGIETVSGSIDAAGFVRDQRYRTVSGDVSLWNVAGTADASTVSGSVTVDGDSDLSLKATSVSGSVRARSGHFSRLRLSTTSGSIIVSGDLDPSGEFRADSVSGSLELATTSGMVLDLKTLSGSIRSEVEHRLEGGRGQWRAIVGDGSAKVRFNSTSGSASIRRTSPAPVGDTRWTRREPPASVATAAATDASARPEPGSSSDVPAAAESPVASDLAATAALSATDASMAEAPTASANGQAQQDTSAESWSADLEGDAGHEETVGATAPETPPGESEELTLLRAVERGELSVEDAAARLEQIRR